MRYIHLFIMLLCAVISSSAVQKKSLIDHISSDTLSNKSFKELKYIFWTHKHDSIIRYNSAEAYLQKAKLINDNINMSQGYYMFSTVYDKLPIISLKYADSMIQVIRGIQHKYLSSGGYMRKGNVLNNLGRYKEALQVYLIAKQQLELNDNHEDVFVLKHNIASLKTVLGKDIEALEVYKENYSYLLTNDPLKKRLELYVSTTYKIAESFIHLKKYDSAYFYINESIGLSLQSINKYHYEDLLVLSGATNYYREEYTASIDSLNKVLVLLKNDVTLLDVKMSYLYLAKTLIKQGNVQESILYLKKIDSVTSASNYVIEIRDAYVLLIDFYKKNNDQKNQLIIMDKLIKYDKILGDKNNELDKDLVVKYDFVQLIKDKELLVSTINSKNKTSRNRVLVLVCFLIFVLCSLFFYLQKKMKKKYKTVLNLQLQKATFLTEKKLKSTVSTLDLSSALKNEILEKLNSFETSNGYLNNNLTLVKASKSMKTNSTYLSKVINMEKGKNFTNYINDLRIEYCMIQIKENRKFRQYSIRSMATEVGFNNIQSFAKAFSKINGCNPAEYVNNLK